ncbi:MAG: hypothetical protein ACSHWR_02145 [Psychromonas sp.]|jgi:hypothetical protein
MLTQHNQSLLSRLYYGKMGLAKTVWLYAVLINLMFTSLLFLPSNDLLNLSLLSAILTYNLIVMSGIWAASERYEGKYLWVALSKCGLILSYFIWAIGAFTVINWILII